MTEAAFDAQVAAMDPAMAVVTAAGDIPGGDDLAEGGGPADGGGERAGEREVDGALVGFHSQCGIEPRRYTVWLSKANRTTRLATSSACTHLAVHGLGPDQHALARHFGAETGDEVDKLAGMAWRAGPGGVPLLDDCPVRFVGRILEVADLGADHLCVVLVPIEATALDEVGEIADPHDLGWLRLHQVGDLSAGHAADEHA